MYVMKMYVFSVSDLDDMYSALVSYTVFQNEI